MTLRRNHKQCSTWLKKVPQYTTKTHKTRPNPHKIKVSIQMKANVNSKQPNHILKKLVISRKISVKSTIKALNTVKHNIQIKGNSLNWEVTRPTYPQPNKCLVDHSLPMAHQHNFQLVSSQVCPHIIKCRCNYRTSLQWHSVKLIATMAITMKLHKF